MVIFNHTRLGVGFRVLCQMVAPPIGLFDNKIEFPVRGNATYFEIITTNLFVGCYALQMKVPMEIRENEASTSAPPDILWVRYSWDGGVYEQMPCRRSWSSLGEGPRTFAYGSVLSPIEVPMNKTIKVQIQFPEAARQFFAEHPGCFLSFGKDSDE